MKNIVFEKYSFSVYTKKAEFLWYTGNTIIKERLKIKFRLKLIASLHLFKSNFTYVAQSKFKKLSRSTIIKKQTVHV